MVNKKVRGWAGAARVVAARLVRPLVAVIVASVPPIVGAVVCWVLFAACVDHPLDPAPPRVRLEVGWDPLACRVEHRVRLTLVDEVGEAATASVPCVLGGMVLELTHGGAYLARFVDEPRAAGAGEGVEYAVVVGGEVRWRLEGAP
jgi:hypothetical protein